MTWRMTWRTTGGRTWGQGVLRAGTRTTLDEDAVEGPGPFVPRALRGPALAWRNTETLRRLGVVAENRQEDVA